MDVSTTNTIISSGAAVVASVTLFVLGAILTYVRSINKTMKHIEEMVIRHDVKIDQLEKAHQSIVRKIYATRP